MCARPTRFRSRLSSPRFAGRGAEEGGRLSPSKGRPWLRALVSIAGLVSSAGVLGSCGDDVPPGGPPNGVCAEAPIAYVFDHVDPWTGVEGAAELLRASGFDVRALPLDADPAGLSGVIVFGSFASESPDYLRYMGERGGRLATFVARGNVILQLTQADQTEAMPAFLPGSLSARRHDQDLAKLYVVRPDNPLVRGVPASEGYLRWSGELVGWETFVSQTGFEVVLAEDGRGGNPALLEGAHGDGRVILAAMAFDKPLGAGASDVPFPTPIGAAEDREHFTSTFFANLRGHVRDVCRKQAPPIDGGGGTPGRPTFERAAFVLAVLPDTQYYSLMFPDIFSAQTGWIVANADRLAIPYVLHLGDIVNNNTEEEWRRARLSMSLLDGVVPYALVPGNHDYGPLGNAATRETFLNQFFPFESQAAWPTFGGAFEPGKLDNTYHLFSAGGRDYIVLALEWGPRDAVIAWANQVMAANPGRDGILVTHAYLNYNDRRYDHTDRVNPQDYNPHDYGTTPGPVNDGEQLWQKLVRRHPFVFVLSGHVLGDGTGYLASVTDAGTTCHQVMSNYQIRTLGGEGYMRLMEFVDDGRTVNVYSYSPLHDAYLTERDQMFSLSLDPPRQATTQGAAATAAATNP